MNLFSTTCIKLISCLYLLDCKINTPSIEGKIYKYIALSVRTCARISHNPHSPSSHHVFTGPIDFQDQVDNCIVASGSNYNVGSAFNNLSAGGYSSKCKDAVCFCLRKVCQESAVWTVLSWTFMGEKRGMGICVKILSPQTETCNISQLIEFRDHD